MNSKSTNGPLQPLSRFLKYRKPISHLFMHATPNPDGSLTVDEDTAYAGFLNEEHRRARRPILFSHPIDGERRADLNAKVSAIIKSAHRPSILAAMSSIGVELAWLNELVGTEAQVLTDVRAYRGLKARFEELAQSLTDLKSLDLRHHRDALKPIAPALVVATNELKKYIAAHPMSLLSLRPRQFEELIADVLKSFGWSVDLTQESKDGGYDIFCVSGLGNSVAPRLSFIVECKLYRPDRMVGVEVARQVLFTKENLKVGGAMLVTSSDFTRGVYNYQAQRRDLDLRNFASVIEWCNHFSNPAAV